MPDFQKIFSIVDSSRVFRNIIFALALMALSYNIAVCWRVFRHEPLREAASRSLMAERSSFFYDSSLAEPLPVFLLKPAMAAGADPDAAVRLEGLAVFALIFFSTIFVLRARFGAFCAGMAALLVGANPYLGYYAMQGSSHLYALFFLLLFWHYNDAPQPSRRSILLAGLYGGLACLSRIDAAWALLILAALSWAGRRQAAQLKAAGLALGAAFVLALPYAAVQKAHYGNLFYSQELELRYLANIDRYGYMPAVAVPQGPMGPAAFVFRNGAAGAFSGMFSGLGRALAYELPRVFYYKFLLVLVFLGFYAAFALKKDPLLFFMAAAVLPVLPLAAIRQVPAAGGLELRYYLLPLWGLCALAGLGFQEILAWVENGITEWAVEKTAALKRRPGGK